MRMAQTVGKIKMRRVVRLEHPAARVKLGVNAGQSDVNASARNHHGDVPNTVEQRIARESI